MTTIAYRSGIMAADSALTQDGALTAQAQKLWRLSDGSIFGGCGLWDNVLRAVDDMKDDPSRKRLTFTVRGPFTALMVRPNGIVHAIEEAGRVYRIRGEFWAIGSGHAFALGAMEVGATARRAVLASCRRDGQSKPPVRVLKLHP